MKNTTQSDKIECYLCGSFDHIKRSGEVRDNKSLEILECQNCGLVFLSKTALSPNFYELSGMHGEKLLDTGEWLRLLDRDDSRRLRYLDELISNRDVLDFGCGPGGFLLKARDRTKSIMGIELEARLACHFQENNLKVYQYLNELSSEDTFDVITAFHVFEHLEDPADMLKQLSRNLKPRGKIIIEIPSATDILLSVYKNSSFSEFTYWSCHLFLFSASNLALLAKKAGLKLNYVNHIQRYPLSNHLYWLANGKPGGHEEWHFLNDHLLEKAYESKLAALGLTDTLIASFSVL